MSAAASRAALKAGVEQVTKEAAGLLDVMVVQPQDLPEILVNATAGDAEATMLLRAVNDALTKINASPRRFPQLCVSCPRPLKKGRYSFGLAIPRCDGPSQMIAMAVCHHCATDRAGVQAHAVSGMRRIWPDLRPIAVNHPAGGRA